MKVKKLSWYGPGFISMSFESKINTSETHIGTCLFIRVQVTKTITRQKMWDSGHEADANRCKDRKNGLTRDRTLLRKIAVISRCIIIGGLSIKTRMISYGVSLRRIPRRNREK